ncbi:hypothetical protein OBBRIDRAFT_823292 [Obba rivulosa]|uniref:CN hydrolase domain-containing protein n=1 Tax=Obba rivulosa TaxID=1052685 RepID=A0A8E2J538_9APHY|nr:hypothetical protein OBBRIDRAFT_823292 [Obba rivulosa]
MQSLAGFILKRPAMLYLSLGPILALFSLSTTPSMTPMIMLLTILRLQTIICIPRRQPGMMRIGLQIILVSAASMVAHMEPSINALSTPSTSILVLGCLSLITSLVAFLGIIVAHFGEHLIPAPWAKATLFPTLWATAWGGVARISPVGQLISWSPVDSIGRYEWLRPITGQYGIDWVTAAWAVVFTELLGVLLMGSGEDSPKEDPEPLVSIPHEDIENGGDIHHNEHTSKTYRIICLTGLLGVLIIPPAFLPVTPSPVYSESSGPLSVACALPYNPSGRQNSLQDYIEETKELQGSAEIILWPETAVRFDSPEEKEAALSAVRNVTSGHKLIGVTFEEYVPPENGTGAKEGTRRNGLILLTKEDGPVFEYHKRMLVPVAESHSMTPSTVAPSIYHFNLPFRKPWTSGQWAPAPNHTRPIPVTASICLDFSSSSSFSHLDSRPALILAPARTWHIGIAYAMWEQARARAEETGSTVLWCDGGADSVSGVVGGGINEFMQRGQGSFVRKIGVQWPFNERRTLFSYGADYAALWITWSIFLGGLAVDAMAVGTIPRRGESDKAWLAIRGHVARIRGMPSGWHFRSQREEERPLLE